MKNVLVTGISGFLGNNTTKFFIEKGFDVTGVDVCDLPEKMPVKFYKGEVTLELLESLNQTFDYIVHCAGGSTVGESIRNPKIEYEKTVVSSFCILEFMRLNNPEAKLIYPSSAAVYGNENMNSIKETDFINPISPYGYYKKQVEDLCECYHKNFGIKSNIIRFFSIYGEGLRKQLLWEACNKLANSSDKIEFFGTGNEVRDWLYVTDAVNLIYLAAVKGKNYDTFNGGTGKGIKINDIITMLADKLNYKAGFAFNNQVRAGDPISYIADINKQLSLGWEQTIPIEQGIQNYVNWYKSQN